MNIEQHSASARRVAAYFAILERSDTTLFNAVQALAVLTNSDIEGLGETRPALAADLLQKFAIK